MEAKMERIDTNVVKFEVKVEAEKFTAALNKAFNKNKGRFNIPGFRKGKVPMAMFKKYYGVEVLFDDAINYLIEETYPAIIDENKINPVDYPQINIVKVNEGEEFVYTAEVTVYPEVELGAYTGLNVEKKVEEVKEEEIENNLKSMQEKNARVESKTEGVVANGDIAVIDFKGFVDGVAFEGGEGHDYPLEIGSKSFIDNFEEQLVGVEVGVLTEVNVTFPEAYGKEELNGKPAKFEVTVNEIRVKELPALDDEFAKEVSEFDTIAELRADIKNKMQTSNEAKAEREYEEALLTVAIENAKMDIPAVMVEKEIDQMLKDLEGKLKYQGLTLEQYMEFTGSNAEKMREYMKENADRKVKADLVLEAIIKAENIEATEEELKAKALEVAKMYSASEHEKMAEMLLNSQKAMVQKDVAISKAFELIKK
ncbi:MAG: trigger factor [Clostridium sp.]